MNAGGCSDGNPPADRPSDRSNWPRHRLGRPRSRKPELSFVRRCCRWLRKIGFFGSAAIIDQPSDISEPEQTLMLIVLDLFKKGFMNKASCASSVMILLSPCPEQWQTLLYLLCFCH
jgi:hypothetical protein